MTKQNWEKEFDSKWYLWDYSKKFGIYTTCGEEVKSFIRQNFISREEVEKLVEGMKYTDEQIKNIGMSWTGHPCQGYNQALADLKQKLDEK